MTRPFKLMEALQVLHSHFINTHSHTYFQLSTPSMHQAEQSPMKGWGKSQAPWQISSRLHWHLVHLKHSPPSWCMSVRFIIPEPGRRFNLPSTHESQPGITTVTYYWKAGHKCVGAEAYETLCESVDSDGRLSWQWRVCDVCFVLEQCSFGSLAALKAEIRKTWAIQLNVFKVNAQTHNQLT